MATHERELTEPVDLVGPDGRLNPAARLVPDATAPLQPLGTLRADQAVGLLGDPRR